jgi:hypothetical protein
MMQRYAAISPSVDERKLMNHFVVAKTKARSGIPQPGDDCTNEPVFTA